ncbi:Acyl-CoA dehydrogenase [Streptomyces sp. YIM 130001]|uniref:acyl-CoA dehydrogenase family protein n=1 Tax=Streptomyces sp. YIM 130001 TaxID=2259644 RepID=UPI000E658D5A|nr:acyl-CoA dehydrogenase family protein [Streptomyces sp. YIM 130001]RII11264.1 Acyl-CoA dehydrogenase [Streptomyces sp. YIM 130001]
MDFTFSEEQQAAAEAAKAIFADVTPDAVPSPALTSGAVADDFDRDLWQRLADADLLSLLLTGDHDGADLDAIALCLVLREAATSLARIPLLENSAAALTIQTHGSTQLKQAVLPHIADGRTVLTVASHGRTGHDSATLAVTASPDPTHHTWTLDGTQTAVPWAHNADHIVVPAHTPQNHPVLAVIPRDATGLHLADQISTTGERLAELHLDAVPVPDTHLIDAGDAWEELHELLTTGTCAQALGLGTAVLKMTSEYTSKREQFGHPVATFQAVAVQTADRYIDLRAMEATLWQAAWRISTRAEGPLPPAGDIAVAKIWAADGVRRVVQTAQHLHGGFGADTDYSLHRYHAWAKHLELSLGPAAQHEETLGELLATHTLS